MSTILVFKSPRANEKTAEMGGFSFVRAPGIEPGPRTWKVHILPLNHARNANQSNIDSF
jgi:hypothetical protein